MIFMDIPHVALRAFRRAKNIDLLAAATTDILARHNHADASFVGHSFGSLCISRICQLFPEVVDSIVSAQTPHHFPLCLIYPPPPPPPLSFSDHVLPSYPAQIHLSCFFLSSSRQYFFPTRCLGCPMDLEVSIISGPQPSKNLLFLSLSHFPIRIQDITS